MSYSISDSSGYRRTDEAIHFDDGIMREEVPPESPLKREALRLLRMPDEEFEKIRDEMRRRSNKRIAQSIERAGRIRLPELPIDISSAA